ncbi:MAG TPA: hypothetical protein VM490_13845 [Armatimonadaceae bacterium]|nr:hypothetical protein [Armatimonadaceae bacterium]
MLKETDTASDMDAGIVVTRLRGEVTEADAARWRTGFLRCVRQALTAPAEDGDRLKLLVDTRHFAPASLAVQRAYHDALADAGAEAAARGLLIAFVHHDAYKMEQMQVSAETGTGYFTDLEDARYWLAPG